MHVWRVDLDCCRHDVDGLPAEERRRAARLTQKRARRRWLASRWALRDVLGRYLDLAATEVELALTGNGKPALAGSTAELRFNLSHSRELALVAVTKENDVGVDVERIAPRRNLTALAARTLGPDAAAAVRATEAGRRAVVFHEAWTRHEATVKCLGTGLRGKRPSLPVAVSPLDPAPGFAAAVAIAAEAMPRLRCLALADEARTGRPSPRRGTGRGAGVAPTAAAR